MPTRRTLVVFASLIGAMTLVSALLLALEPAPAKSGRLPTLSQLTPQSAQQGETELFNGNTASVRPWQAIVVTFSGYRTGTARTLNADHQQLGLGSLGYHLVINNGRGGPDGRVEIGPRWRGQEPGAHTSGPHADWYNANAVGICLIGEGYDAPTDAQLRSLVWLVQQLQVKLGIPAQNVILPEQSRLFPVAKLRQQLLNPVVR